MHKIKCIVVDDEPLAVEMLATYIRKTPSLELAGTFTDPVQAVSAMAEIKPDLVFLDIQMPDLNGLELARLIPEDTRIIFTSAFRQYAFESYEVEALDYILKPIRYQKFLEAVSKAEKWMANRPEKSRRSAFIKTDREYRNIEFDQILYVAGMKDYVLIYLTSEPEPIVTHITLKAIEEKLPSDMFMRVHRSYIVALNKITAIDSCGDILIDKISVPVSDSYRKEIEKHVKENLLAR
ncbi:MAG: response regulator transcription factor [Bacteroidales bacterium]|nr:response regulator transcription factor [Bacteroidales bacterium]